MLAKVGLDNVPAAESGISASSFSDYTGTEEVEQKLLSLSILNGMKVL